MGIEFDDKGKFYTDIISKVTIPAMIQTTQHRIQGLVHIRPNGRFKDELDNDEPFLAVTAAKVFNEIGEVLFEADFISVRRSQIVWVIPHEEKSQGSEGAQ
jgi:Family of unknown function (DUF6812)